MANPLYNQHGNSAVNNPIADFAQQFNQFRQTITGNPQQMVQNLLNNGQMSQQQFNQLVMQANQIMAIMPK